MFAGADLQTYATETDQVARSVHDLFMQALLTALRDSDQSEVWAVLEAATEQVRDWHSRYGGQGGERFETDLAEWTRRWRDHLDGWVDDPENDREDADSVATGLTTSGNNLAMLHSEGYGAVAKTWVSVGDAKVRPSHRALHGQTIGIDETFDVGGASLAYPHDPSGPPGETINCRCVLALGTMAVAATSEDLARFSAGPTEGESMDTDEITEVEEFDTVEAPPQVRFHGILAPEGVVSGDRRKFMPESVTNRDLPLPFYYQPATSDGHDGAVTVGRIDTIERRDHLIAYEGTFLDSDYTDEVIYFIAEGALRGVSIDADDVEMHLQRADGTVFDITEGMNPDDFIVEAFDRIRVSAATAVGIPAFPEATIALGTWADSEAVPDAGNDDPEEDDEDDALAAAGPRNLHHFRTDIEIGTIDPDVFRVVTGVDLATFVSESSWDGSASRFTPEEWHRSCILHTHSGEPDGKGECKLPVREPGGALSRAGVHAAASRIGQVDAPPEAVSKAKASLRSAYKELGEETPDALAASGELSDDLLALFARTEDGPGWLTHPVDTDRLRDYWVRGRGAAKIAWGTPGDFNRCRANLAKYVKPQHLSGYCANRHYDALKTWPGRHGASTVVASADLGEMAPSMRLVRSEALVADAGQPWRARKEWFSDPQFADVSNLVITEEGRVFGHLATWGTCHIGIDGVCIEPPSSPSGYARYRLGTVLADDGEQIPVGRITMGTGHAGMKLRATAAAAHYDNTGTCVAYVASGEDQFGIWIAGQIAPGVTEDQITMLRAASLSGDWRDYGEGIDLVAALAVNVPGFPIVHPALAASGAGQTALVAAGVVPPAGNPEERDERIARAAARAVLDEQAERTEAKVRMETLRRERAEREMSALRRSRLVATTGRK